MLQRVTLTRCALRQNSTAFRLVQCRLVTISRMWILWDRNENLIMGMGDGNSSSISISRSVQSVLIGLKPTPTIRNAKGQVPDNLRRRRRADDGGLEGTRKQRARSGYPFQS